jgi:hypothetical protein
VTGFRATTIGVNDDLHIGGFYNVLVGNSYGVKIGGSFASDADGDHAWKSTNAYFEQSSAFHVKAGGCTLSMSAGVVHIDNGAGSSISLAGGSIVVNAGAGMVTIVGGPKLSVVSGPVTVGAGGDINATAPNIHLNG